MSEFLSRNTSKWTGIEPRSWEVSNSIRTEAAQLAHGDPCGPCGDLVGSVLKLRKGHESLGFTIEELRRLTAMRTVLMKVLRGPKAVEEIIS
jgi:hypothetical protein